MVMVSTLSDAHSSMKIQVSPCTRDVRPRFYKNTLVLSTKQLNTRLIAHTPHISNPVQPSLIPLLAMVNGAYCDFDFTHVLNRKDCGITERILLGTLGRNLVKSGSLFGLYPLVCPASLNPPPSFPVFLQTNEDMYGTLGVYYEMPAVSIRNALWVDAEHAHDGLDWNRFMAYDRVHPRDPGMR